MTRSKARIVATSGILGALPVRGVVIYRQSQASGALIGLAGLLLVACSGETSSRPKNVASGGRGGDEAAGTGGTQNEAGRSTSGGSGELPEQGGKGGQFAEPPSGEAGAVSAPTTRVCSEPTASGCPNGLAEYAGSLVDMSQRCLGEPVPLSCSDSATATETCWVDVESASLYRLPSGPCMPGEKWRECTAQEQASARDINTPCE